MPTGIDPSQTSQAWVFRIRRPADLPPRRAVVLIHGWTGDENSMEIFSSSLPNDCLQVFPRGPIKAPEGGYGWVAAREDAFPGLETFKAVSDRFIHALEEQLSPNSTSNIPVDLVGFSQGAAMCYALALLYPQRFQRIAALAGFLPRLPDGFDLAGSQNQSYFIAHGSRDETIPVEMARRGAAILSAAGLRVDYCESDAGHKLAAQCFKRLKSFMSTRP